MTTSNTKECFTTFTGKRLVGVLFAALPLEDRGIASRTKTLVFDDGRGLTLSDNGSFWVDSARDVSRALDERRAELERSQEAIREALEMAGAVGAVARSDGSTPV